MYVCKFLFNILKKDFVTEGNGFFIIHDVLKTVPISPSILKSFNSDFIKVV